MKNIAGFTLIELIVTVCVLAIVVAFGIPKLQGLASGDRMSATVNAFASDLSLARSEAVNRNRQIDIAAVGGNWLNGWTVSAPAIAVSNLDFLQIRTAGPIPRGMTFKSSTLIVSYTGDGLKSTANNVNLTLCHPRKQFRFIQIGPTGRHNTYIDTDNSVQTTCPP